MKDSNMDTPAMVPGLAHSGSPTALSNFREARVLSQSTGCKGRVRDKRKTQQRSHTAASWRSVNFKEVRKVLSLSTGLCYQQAKTSESCINHTSAAFISRAAKEIQTFGQ